MTKPHQLTTETNWKTRLLSSDRSLKRLVLMASDGIVFAISLWLAMIMRHGSIVFPTDERLDGLYFVLPVVGISVFWYLGVYRMMVRSMENRSIMTLAIGSIIAALLVQIWPFYDQKLLVPRSVPFIYVMLVFVGVGVTRLILRGIYTALSSSTGKIERVVIYGAGALGTQLAAMLNNASGYRVMAFIDDNPKLRNVRVRGVRVFSPEGIKDIQEQYGVDQVILALSNIPGERHLEIVQSLASLGVPINRVPGIADIIGGHTHSPSVEPVKIEDLLGRSSVAPIDGLVEANVAGKNILVTGAAGSIGSEIVSQLIGAGPALIVAYDISEFSLYTFEQSMAKVRKHDDVEIVYLLGNVLDRNRIQATMRDRNIDIVYHAAAYKHVPIVENNPLVAIENNALGTLVVAEEALRHGIDRFVLISTDKAVRPTNVMGASKRLAELFVQDIATRDGKTTFCMVRFGNVLGSSGSVIPLFRKQIENGGPITLTHKDVTRFFMTVTEAAQLVLQAGFLAKGGEVFVLDMGNPVRLLDLAHLMINLSGRKVAESGQDPNEIKIDIIGLRPGEKLYEELLIGGNVSGTLHPKIMSAMESKLNKEETKKTHGSIKKFVASGDKESAIELLRKLTNFGESTASS